MVAIAGSAITVLYTWVGGFWAVVYTDLLQFVVLATGITTAARLPAAAAWCGRPISSFH